LLSSLLAPVAAMATTPCYRIDDTGYYPANTLAAGNRFDYTTTPTSTVPCAGAVLIQEGVVGIAPTAFQHNSGVTSITLPSSLATIGEYAFQDMSQLTSISFPATGSLTTIGGSAFIDTPLLTSITLPRGARYIDPQAFSGATGLVAINVSEPNPYFSSEDGVLFNDDKTTLVAYPSAKTSTSYTVPNNVTAIGAYAFGSVITPRTGVLTDIILPNGLTSIGEGAFKNSSNLRNVNIPSTVTSLGAYAFESATSVASVSLPEGLLTIGDGAFAFATSLSQLVIPTTVTSLGQGALDGASSLTSLTLPGNLSQPQDGLFSDLSALSSIAFNSPSSIYRVEDGVLFNTALTTLYRYPATKAGSTYQIPSSVTTIARGSFKGAQLLTSITIPSTVTTVEYESFKDTVLLGHVTFGASVLDSINFEFDGIFGSSVTEVTIASGATAIPEYGFGGAEALQTVRIPSTLTTIGIDAFRNATSLSSVIFAPNSQLTEIRSHAFRNASSLESFDFPSALTSIGNSAFRGATALEAITIPATVTGIDGSAFRGTTALVSVNFEAGSQLEYIADCAFCGASSLETITIPALVLDLGWAVFEYATSLRTVFFAPNSRLQTIGGDIFYGASSLQSISIPATVEYLGSNAFSDATSLSSITIPASVSEIADWTFNGATALTSFYFLGDAPTVSPSSTHAFTGVPASAKAYIQPGATGFGNVGDLWNGLTVEISPYVGAPPVQYPSQNQNQNQNQNQIAPASSPIAPVINTSLGRIVISSNATSFAIVGGNMASITSIKVGGKETKFANQGLGGVVVDFKPTTTGSYDIVIVHAGGTISLLGFAQVVKPYDLTRTVKISQFVGNRPTLAGLRALDRAFLADKTANRLSCVATVASDSSVEEVALAEARAKRSCQRIVNHSRNIDSANVQILKDGKPGSKTVIVVTFDRTLDGK
jgi:hypothetical protein